MSAADAAPFAPFAAALVWCILHFTAYILMRSRLRRERAIFAFHAVPFAVFFLVVAIVWLMTPMPPAVAAGLLAIHSIYSLSFLEAWSLSDGSYSITILNAIGSGRIVDPDSAINALARVGEGKKNDRLAALRSLGLVRDGGRGQVLTPAGARLASAYRAIRWLVNYRDGD